MELNNLAELVFDADLLNLDRQLQKCQVRDTQLNKSNLSPFERIRNKVIDDTLEEDLTTEVELKGDKVCADLRRALDVLKTAHKTQKMFFELFFQASLPHIYGKKDFEANELRIKLENNIEEFYRLIMICCPRRFGKTRSVSWYAACALLTIPDADIVVFSPGKRQSMMMVGQIRQDCELLQKNGFDFEVIKGENNKEEFGIKVNGNKRRLRGLPSKQQTVRGIGGTLLICEEAAQMDDDFIYEVVIPLIGVEKTALVCLSTVQSDLNYYSKLIDLKYSNGKLMFYTFKFFAACEDCMKAGIGHKCEHKASEMPEWLTQSAQKLIREIYEQMDQRGHLEQETLGISQKENQAAFAPDQVNKFFNHIETPRFKESLIDIEPDKCYVAIDPTGGGKFSDLSMMCAVYVGGTFVLVGGESINAKRENEFLPQIVQNLHGIRTFHAFRNVKFVIFVESNSGILGRNIEDYLIANVKKIHIVSKDDFDIGGVDYGKHSSNGLQTTNKVKENMYLCMKNRFHMQTIRIFENFVVLHDPEASSKNPKSAHEIRTLYLGRLKKQLLQWEIIKKLPVDAQYGGKMKITYNGKAHGADDCACVTQLCLSWAEETRNNPRFRVQ